MPCVSPRKLSCLSRACRAASVALVASLLAHSPIANTEDEESWQREYSDGLENELYVIRLRDAATMAGVNAKSASASSLNGQSHTAARAAVWGGRKG